MDGKQEQGLKQPHIITNMSNRCKHFCDRYPDIKHKYLSYDTGLIAFCSVCEKTMWREDIVKYRCPCCNTVVRTNPRTRSKRLLMTVD